MMSIMTMMAIPGQQLRFHYEYDDVKDDEDEHYDNVLFKSKGGNLFMDI